ncbi:MAG: hypothetical protein GXO54_05935 [Chloroflexi bacterium]|nr:hypothetical protein [Chloroflexota bacterium]
MARPRRPWPDPDKLSLFSAATTLVIVLNRWPALQTPLWTWQGPEAPSGTIHISPQSLLILILAALGLTGTDWVLRDHPAYPSLRSRGLWHALLPTFALDALATLIRDWPMGWTWLFVLLFGLVSVLVILIAEFIVVDPQDPRALWANWALQAMGYGLFFLFTLGLYQGRWPLLARPFLLAVAAWFIGHRLWALQAPRASLGPEGFTLALLAAHWGWALSLLREVGLAPAGASLLLLAAVYGWTQVVMGLLQGHATRDAFRMALGPSLAFVLLALLFWGDGTL